MKDDSDIRIVLPSYNGMAVYAYLCDFQNNTEDDLRVMKNSVAAGTWTISDIHLYEEIFENYLWSVEWTYDGYKVYCVEDQSLIKAYEKALKCLEEREYK